MKRALEVGPVRIFFDRDDWWVGYYRGESKHFVCVAPTLVISWPRSLPDNRAAALSWYDEPWSDPGSNPAADIRAMQAVDREQGRAVIPPRSQRRPGHE